MKVGIYGATGTMGNGIAQVFAMAEGWDVVLVGTSPEKHAREKRKSKKLLQREWQRARWRKKLLRRLLQVSSQVGQMRIVWTAI